MNNKLEIREICLEDYKEIYNLNEQLGYIYSLDEIKERIIKIQNKTDNKVFVSCINKKVIGYIHLSPYELLHYNSLVNVLGFIVDKEFRRKGIGKQLFSFAEEWTKNNGYKGIRLDSGYEREVAHKFYISQDFKTGKIHKNFVKIF